MPAIATATIASKSTLPCARVLARSFLEHHPGVPFFVLLADEVQGCFTPEDEPFDPLLLRDLRVPDLPHFCFAHGEPELSYASTPYLLDALLDRDFSRVLFIKQESVVLGDLRPELDQLARHAILLTPHLLEPLAGSDRGVRELNILQSGAFNAGVVGVSEQPAARRFLHWWQERLYEHCRHAVAEGMHYEQRWLDLVPVLFEDVCVVRDPAANVGHWNLPERAAEKPRLFRFSGFDPELPQQVTRYSSRLAASDLGAAAKAFASYANALRASGWEEARRWPYAYGSFTNGVEIPAFARELYRSLGAAAERFGDPFDTSRPGSYFAWLNEPVNGNRVTRFWNELHRHRPDLQAAFPDPGDGDAGAYMAWAATHGLREYQIAEAFVT